MEHPNNLTGLQISAVMTREPCTVASDLSLADAQQRMYVNNIRHLVVVDGGFVRGVISTRDIAFVSTLTNVDPAKITVAAAMTSHPYSCTPETTVLEVAQQMEEHRYGCVVVLDQGQPVGMFTTTDALRVLRTALSGDAVEPAVKPTHVLTQPGEREKVAHPRISAHGVSQNMGRAFDTKS